MYPSCHGNTHLTNNSHNRNTYFSCFYSNNVFPMRFFIILRQKRAGGTKINSSPLLWTQNNTYTKKKKSLFIGRMQKLFSPPAKRLFVHPFRVIVVSLKSYLFHFRFFFLLILLKKYFIVGNKSKVQSKLRVWEYERSEEHFCSYAVTS